MESIVQDILSLLGTPAIEYADVRFVHRTEEQLSAKNGVLEAWSDEDSAGYGVRVLAGGAWGFAASLDHSSAGQKHTVETAVRRAKAAAGSPHALRFPRSRGHRDTVEYSPSEDPFALPADTKIEMLLSACDALEHPDVTVRTATCGAVFEDKVFGSTEGALIRQSRTYSGGGIAATCVRGNDVQVRSYPAAHGGTWRLGGFEVVREMRLVQNAPRIAEEAARLLDADPCPADVTTIVTDADQTALQVHESIGHPTELDRILGSEAGYAGTSFVAPRDVGSLRYGSEIVNVTADATTRGGLGTFAYDDEGTPGARVDLIRDGVLCGLQTSRETVAALPALPEQAGTAGDESSGAMRASSWNRMPLIRMTNINLLPQHGTLDDLLAEVDDGVLLETNKSWSIDDRRLNFHFATEIGWEIRQGRRTRMLRNCSYSGTTPEFWRSCRRIGGPETVVLVGLTNCGKGQPGQSMTVSHATPPAMFDRVRVGPA